jgi:predicted nuclease of restriction endonuclease-like (RecB) superfamily
MKNKRVLVCWIGNTDLRAAEGEEAAGQGPIGQAVEARTFDQVVLLSDHAKTTASAYVKWLQGKTSGGVELRMHKLPGPTDFGAIYSAVVAELLNLQQSHGKDVELVFHLSPGTPAMAAVWILLAKTRFPAELIESSKEHGVRTANVPFDISAEFIPELLRRSDQRLERLAQGLPDEAPEFADIIHRSPQMQQVIGRARRVALRGIPVLIEGESGTGKELLARAIHRASPRAAKPFIAVNCGAIPSELVESEFFGHKKGGFTGATADRQGHFESAQGGTLFLDEIGELPKAIQVKLIAYNLSAKPPTQLHNNEPIMTDSPDTALGLTPVPAGYAEWLADIKARIHTAQQRAALAVNRELLALYWRIGHDILRRQAEQGWGAKVIGRLSHDLRRLSRHERLLPRQPHVHARLRRGLDRSRNCPTACWTIALGPQPGAADQAQSPRGPPRLCPRRALEHGWSRNTLNMHIGTRLLEREGKAVTNFGQRLPAPHSDLARATLKDPYLFDFLDVAEEADEREIESALVRHITRFLLELGAGFAFVGRQVHIEVGGDDFFIDLLFYHLKLRCYVVVELKAGPFKPEHAGQLNFYLSAVDSLVKAEQDNPSIGLLLCKSQNRVVAEYALRDTRKPMGVAEYQLIESLPRDLQTSLPSIEQIETELAAPAPPDTED